MCASVARPLVDADFVEPTVEPAPQPTVAPPNPTSPASPEPSFEATLAPTRIPTDPPTPFDAAAPTATPTTCVDDPDWESAYGDCESYGPGGDNEQFCADDFACSICACSCEADAGCSVDDPGNPTTAPVAALTATSGNAG